MSNVVYKQVCKSLGKLTAAQMEDVANRIYTLRNLDGRAKMLRDHDLGNSEDDEFLSFVLKLNGMADTPRAVAAAKKVVSAKSVTTARIAVITAYNAAAEARDQFAVLRYPARVWVYTWFISAGRDVAARETQGNIAGVLQDAADDFNRLRGLLIEHGMASAARQTFTIQKKLQEAASPRLPLKVLIAVLIRADYILDSEAPMARSWKKLGAEVRALMNRRGAKID